jgi:hypothetical protein
MSQPSRRLQREAIKEQRRKKKRQHRALRDRQLSEGLLPPTPPALPNTCSAYATVAHSVRAKKR